MRKCSSVAEVLDSDAQPVRSTKVQIATTGNSSKLERVGIVCWREELLLAALSMMIRPSSAINDVFNV